MGIGSFGYVYAEPRFPCEGETYEDVVGKHEVSKFFREEEEASKEFGVIVRLQQGMNEDEINELRQYTILPKQLCRGTINRGVASRFSSDWFKDKYGRLPSGAPRSATDLMGQMMVISEKGAHDLHTELGKIRTLDDVKPALVGMGNVLKGIQTLANKNYCHLDLKTTNCVAMEAPAGEKSTDYRIIDMADVFNFVTDATVDTILTPSTAFMYEVYCPDATMCIYLANDDMQTHLGETYIEIFTDEDYNNLSQERLTEVMNFIGERYKNPRGRNFREKGIQVSPRILSLLFLNQSGFNESVYSTLFNKHVVYLNSAENKQLFSEEDKSRMFAMEEDIRNYRFFFATPENYSSQQKYVYFFMKKFLSSEYFGEAHREQHGLTQTMNFLNQMEEFYSQFETETEMAKTLLPYVMMYSFGNILYGIYLDLIRIQGIVGDASRMDEYRDITMNLLSFLHKIMRGAMNMTKLDEASDVSAFNQMCEYYYRTFGGSDMGDISEPSVRMSPSPDATASGAAPMQMPTLEDLSHLHSQTPQSSRKTRRRQRGRRGRRRRKPPQSEKE